FNTQEHSNEASGFHQCQKLGIVGQVHRCLCEECKWPAMPIVPFSHCGKQPFDILLVSDEIVVYKKDRPSPVATIQLFQLGKDLSHGLRSGLAPIDLNDVAELAVVGATTGILDGHRAI